MTNQCSVTYVVLLLVYICSRVVFVQQYMHIMLREEQTKVTRCSPVLSSIECFKDC